MYISWMLIDGRYRILGNLGKGVSGDVHLVEDTRDQSQLALKFLRIESLHLTPEQLLDRFKQEFAILKELKHPHIARISDFGFDEASHQHYFTEEHVEGIPITEAAQNTSPEIIEEMIVQTLRALEFLHARQIYHYDLKPANLYVEKNSGQIKVIDFGLANLPGQSISGTPTYMAPEICLQQPRDGRVDLYALGVIWYQCLSGTNPFKDKGIQKTMERQVHFVAPSISSKCKEAPPYLDDILARLLAKNPLHRYGRAAQVIRDINFRGEKNYPIETGATSVGYLPEVGTLIGRSSEWEQIQSYIDALRLNIKRESIPFIMISGGSGLGKSRLCEEARYYAQLNDTPLEILDHDHPLTNAALGILRIKTLHRSKNRDPLLITLYPNDANALTDWLPKKQVQRIDLSPFGPSEIEHYLRHVTGMEEIPQSLCEALTTRSEGNPRLLRELLVTCFAEHTFCDEFGRWTPGAFKDLQKESERLPMPSALGQWFETRIAGLSKTHLKALQAIAICEQPVNRFALEKLAGPMRKWAIPLTYDGWITRSDESFCLRNPACHEWLSKQLSRKDKMKWHDQVIAIHSDLPNEDLEYHQVFSSDPKQILPAAQRYPQKLIQNEEWDKAAEALAWAWKSLPVTAQTISIGVQWIDVLVELEREKELHEAQQHVTKAIEKLPKKDQANARQSLEDKIIEWFLRQQDYTPAQKRIEESLATQNERTPTQIIRLQNYLGRIFLEQGELKKAETILEATWRQSESLCSKEQYHTANNDLGLVFLTSNQYETAVAHFNQELLRIRQWKDPYLEARCLYNLSEATRGAGDNKSAEDYLSSAYDLSQSIGRHELTLRILNALGNIAQDRDDTNSAIDYYERGLRLAERLGDRDSCAALATNLGILLHSSNKNEDALSHLSHARHLLRHTPHSPTEAGYLARCLLELALLKREEGNESDAEMTLSEAHKVAQDEGAEFLLPFIENAQEESKMKPSVPSEATRSEASRSSDLELILRVNQQLAHVTDVPQLLQQILTHAVTMAHAEYGIILLLDEKDELQVEATLNVEADDALKQISCTMAQRAIKSGSSLITDDAQDEDSYRSTESVMMAQLRAVAVVPIHAASKVIGCLYLSHRYQIGAFSNIDVTVLSAFADQAGIAIDRARLLSASRKQTDQLKESLTEREQEISLLEAQVQSKATPTSFSIDQLRSSNAQMGKLFDLVRKISPTDLSVFVRGDTGTGKELIARLLHSKHPKRGKGPFIALSCGAIPKELMESELFGYKAGAFTGATRDKVGLFEAADGGTLFLDEVAELSLELQAKLLRVLQEREVQRLGETKPRSFDCRVLSASHQDLKARIQEGTFREDLYYRLCQIQLDIPPLNERREDIPELIEHFVERYCKQHKVKPLKVERSLLHRLMAYDWPGNIRELENLILAMSALCDGKWLREEDVPPHHPLADHKSTMQVGLSTSQQGKLPSHAARSAQPVTHDQVTAIDDYNTYDVRKPWRDYEQLIIAKAYQHCGHDARKCAEALGLSIAKVYKVVKQLDLKDQSHPLYADPFQYSKGETLNVYMTKIFRAARSAAGGKPYAAIRNLRVSPGFYYKIIPVK